MLEVLPETHDNVLAVRVSKELSVPDFDRYRNMASDLMRKHKETHIYYEMADVNWVQPVAAIESALFDVIHAFDYGRIAMVGDKRWQEWGAKVASRVKKDGIRYFDPAHKEQAMKWVLKGE
ncbi:STAS/SEC14 domain-containing protein [Pontibacter ruber]|uniref:STAS/SEC14 domain-containing protein n=1 Tax=Pontibacter ruber TaxID=1343895 RepID=A0ABW5D231_9BACT|nr:STAS/SEC14 domain-containing protein [Pontibacter ruber]